MMFKSLPPDTVVFDQATLLHARMEKSNGQRRLARARTWRLGPEVFAPDSISPRLADPESLRQTIRRLRQDAGEFDAAFVLLPDSWFRMSILELKGLPERWAEADEMVRWTFRRSIPTRPDDLRIGWQPLPKINGSSRVMVAAASEKTLAAIEESFAAEQIRVGLIEPTGLNVWNAVASRQNHAADRMFFYFRGEELTMTYFSGASPVFHRSRTVGSERPVEKELKLSASYVRSKLQPARLEECIVSGSRLEPSLLDTIAEQFGAPVRVASLSDFGLNSRTFDAVDVEAELMACLGVYVS